MSINLKHTLYLSLAALTLFSTGTPIVNAAKNNQASSEKQTNPKNQSSSSQKNRVNKSYSSSSSSSKYESSTKNSSSSKNSKNNGQTSKSSAKNNGTNNTKVTIVSNKKMPKQKYDNVLTGKAQIFNNPSSISGSKVTFNKSAIKKLMKQKATFMTYRVAKTSDGSTYYKIVSRYHSVRGWIYTTGISSTNGSKSNRKKNNKQKQAEKALLGKINGMISNAKDLANQAQTASNNHNNDSSNSLMQQANQQVNDAQTAAGQLNNDDDKNSTALAISQVTSYIQKIQAGIQSASNASDDNYLNSANNFINTAYNSLNMVKLNMRNSNISPLDITNQIILAQNALQGANNAVNQISNTSTKSGVVTQINNAIDYMTTLANNAKNIGVDTPNSIPSNDTIRYALITHYVDKAHFYIDDIRNNQLTSNNSNKARIANDISNAKASLQVAYNLMLGLQDSSLSTSANQLISGGISYIQANSTIVSSSSNSSSASNAASNNAITSNAATSSSASSSSSNASNAIDSTYLSGNHTISK